MPDNTTDVSNITRPSGLMSGSSGWLAKIAAATAALVVIGSFLDACVAVVTKGTAFTCNVTQALPWCSGARPETPVRPEQPVRVAAENQATRVSSFVIMVYSPAGGPAGGASSARRDWKRVAPDRWAEIYPSGAVSYFEIMDRRVLDGCEGTTAKSQANQMHLVFIPDKGCAGMQFYISSDNKNWGVASAMNDVQ